MVSRRSKLTVLCFILSCMYYLSMGETLIKFSYLILSYLMCSLSCITLVAVCRVLSIEHCAYAVVSIINAKVVRIGPEAREKVIKHSVLVDGAAPIHNSLVMSCYRSEVTICENSKY